MYDPETERYATVAGGARGYLDGPFSRARFGGWGYVASVSTRCSADGRYLYFTEPDLGGIVRRLDFEARAVTTVLTEPGGFLSLTSNSAGDLYAMGWQGLAILRVDGTIERPATDSGYIQHGFSATLDEVNNRLYGANRCAGDWYVWYWDLNDGGRFVGVLPIAAEGEPVRGLNETGPFDGANLHCPGGISFGPDDPARNFLYYGGGDNTTFYRLDLGARSIDAFAPVDPSDAVPFDALGFVQSGNLPFGSIVSWAGLPKWGDDDDIFLGNPIWPVLYRFRRTQ